MTLRALFRAADGRIRPLWRLLLFGLLVIACAAAVFLLLGGVLRAAGRAVGIVGTAESLGLAIALLLAHAIAVRTFDDRGASFVGLQRRAAQPGRLAAGLLLGGVPIAAASLALLAAGLLDVADAPDGSWLKAAARVTIMLAPAALYEELLSRGYLFATLAEWLGKPAAVAMTSIGFGLLHVPNQGAGFIPIVAVTLAGVYLACVLLATGSLWAAWTAHLAWNWVMAVPLHITVSGVPFPRPDYQIVENGPDWLTGGPWGPEGGIAAVAGMAVGLTYLYWRHTRRKHEQR